jgi:SAM-dependent methyltransferase
MMDENLSAYRADSAVRSYFIAAQDGLTAPEALCLEYVPSTRHGSILDIGIGAGRTTGPLAGIFEKYVGVDYSPELVEAARARFPGKELRIMDARELNFDEKFDCVMFSYNGIDYVSYADRQLILRQIASALRRGGYFIYSTHNLDYRRTGVWTKHFWVRELVGSARQLLRPWQLLRRIANRLRSFQRQSVDESLGLAYVNDPGLGFALVTTYVNLAKEQETLHDLGLRVLVTVGNTRQGPGYDANDNWVYILAEKTEIVKECGD